MNILPECLDVWPFKSHSDWSVIISDWIRCWQDELVKLHCSVVFTSDAIYEASQRKERLSQLPELDTCSISHSVACGGLSVSSCWVERIKTGPHLSRFALKDLQGREREASGSDFSPCCAMQMFSTCLSDLLRKSLCDLLQPGLVLGIVCQIPLKVGKVDLFKDHMKTANAFPGWIPTSPCFLPSLARASEICSAVCFASWFGE